MSMSSAFAMPAMLLELDRTPLGVGGDAGILHRSFLQAVSHYHAPVSRQSIAQQFRGLAGTWREETKLASTASDLFLNSAYQRIIGLGPDVIPVILGDMQQRPDHWFVALSALTGADPIPEEARGRLRAMTEAWLRWGAEEGLLAR